MLRALVHSAQLTSIAKAALAQVSLRVAGATRAHSLDMKLATCHRAQGVDDIHAASFIGASHRGRPYTRGDLSADTQVCRPHGRCRRSSSRG